MNRRDFLRNASRIAAASLVPSWLVPAARPSHGIDLRPFCRVERGTIRQYDMTVPFAQPGVVDHANGSHMEIFRYATDGRICVRLPINTGDLVDCEKKNLPPANSLNWTHAHKGRWLRWPKANYLVAHDGECPRCRGTGDLAGVPSECEVCVGTGSEWVGGEWDISHPVTCRACGGIGAFIVDLCPDCKGNAIGEFPAIQRLDGLYISSFEHGRVAKYLSDVEYFVPEGGVDDSRALKIRFAGGIGLLMPLVTKRAEERLKGVFVVKGGT